MTKLHNDYYTYAYLREDKTPYYIGKGRGNRVYDKRKTIKPPKDKSLILFLKKSLTEAEAFKHEIYMIFVLGRKDLGTGILRNRTDGGEGSSGAVQSEERKKAHSERMSGEKNPCYGRTGEKHPNYNVPNTEAQKKAKSEKLSGRFLGALNPSSKGVTAIKPDGTELHFGSGREAARALGISSGTLSTRYLKPCKQPKWGKFKGWQFLFKNSENF